MHVSIIVGLVLVPFAILLMMGANKKHRETTGVAGPSSKTFNRFYRRAAEKGTSVDEEYQRWLRRKQKEEENRRLRAAGLKPPRRRRS